METPLSSRRVTRSQTLASSNNGIPVSKGKNEGSEKSASKTRTRNGKQQEDEERSALIDITNDSPIVGVAMETTSAVVGKGKTNMMTMMTPGSGEALLRGQVKNLLQKVEEEAEVSKVPLESRPFVHLQSPMALVDPTPANTPQISNLSEDGALGSMLMDPVVEEELNISEMMSGNIVGTGVESQKCMITRSLLLDFAEKTECCSDDRVIITEDSSASKEKALAFQNDDIDSASIWSIQVNASTHDEEEDGGSVDELCKSISKISMTEMYTGKHTRFVDNSDDEIEEEEEEEWGENGEYSSDIMRLKGLPTPKGKHLRFPLEEEVELCKGIRKISMTEMFMGKHTRFVYNSDDEIEEEEEEEWGEDGEYSSDIMRLKGLPTPKGKHLRFPLEEEDEQD